MKLTHVMFGTNDLDRAREFYDATLSVIGYPPAEHDAHRAQYALPGTPPLMIGLPFDGQPANFGNGTMIGFAASSKGEVDAFYSAAMTHGGRCEGPPGPRDYAPTLYGAYVRDPDGNKMSIYYFGG